MGAVRRLASVGLLAGMVGLGPFVSAQQAPEGKAGRMEFSAILSNISNAGGVGITPLTIRIHRWTPDEEHERLMAELRERGQDAFLRELTKVDPVGSIATPTSLKWDFFYARAQAVDGGQRIFMITDRPMDPAERMYSMRTRDYPFSVIDMTIPKDGLGQGTLAQLVQLKLVGEFLGIENLASGPMKLSEIKRVK